MNTQAAAPSIETADLAHFPIKTGHLWDLENPAAARKYLMGFKTHIQVSDGSISMMITMRTDESSTRFAQCVRAFGGEVWSIKPLGRGRGYRVEFVMDLAWDAYFGARR